MLRNRLPAVYNTYNGVLCFHNLKVGGSQLFRVYMFKSKFFTTDFWSCVLHISNLIQFHIFYVYRQAAVHYMTSSWNLPSSVYISGVQLINLYFRSQVVAVCCILLWSKVGVLKSEPSISGTRETICAVKLSTNEKAIKCFHFFNPPPPYYHPPTHPKSQPYLPKQSPGSSKSKFDKRIWSLVGTYYTASWLIEAGCLLIGDCWTCK